MDLHDLKPDHARKKKKRIGRGGKRGTYSGRGQKGQKSRAGHKLQPVIRRLFKKYPKKRGYRFKPVSEKPQVVNVSTLSKNFEKGDEVSPKTLLERGIVRKRGGKDPKVKILGEGEIDKELIVKNCLLSKYAEEKIKNAGKK